MYDDDDDDDDEWWWILFLCLFIDHYHHHHHYFYYHIIGDGNSMALRAGIPLQDPGEYDYYVLYTWLITLIVWYSSLQLSSWSSSSSL